MDEKKSADYWLGVLNELLKVYLSWNSQLLFYGGNKTINLVIRIPVKAMFDRGVLLIKYLWFVNKYNLSFEINNG